VELRDIDEYAILNVGIVYALNRELAFLVGGGRAQHRVIREFVEALEPGEAFRVSQGGAYFVPLDEDAPWTTQLVVGMLFRANSSFSLRAGYETAARGMSVGAYWTPGRWSPPACEVSGCDEGERGDEPMREIFWLP